MKIETEFDIDDEVFFMKNNKIIQDVTLYVNSEGCHGKLFKTKQLLLDSL